MTFNLRALGRVFIQLSTGYSRVTCVPQVCDFALVGKIFMTTSVLLKLPSPPCRPNALLAPEVLSSGKCLRFVLPGLSLRSMAWCLRSVSFSWRKEWRKRQPLPPSPSPKKKKRREHEKSDNNFLPSLISECLCNFDVCGSWANRRMPHLQHVSDPLKRGGTTRQHDVGHARLRGRQRCTS